jgi:hypothetical protein
MILAWSCSIPQRCNAPHAAMICSEYVAVLQRFIETRSTLNYGWVHWLGLSWSIHDSAVHPASRLHRCDIQGLA